MLTVQLPVPFLKAMLDNPRCIEVWAIWISSYGEKIKDPFFMDWLDKTEKPLPEVFEKLKIVHERGKPYLAGISFGKLKKTTKKSKITDVNIDQQARRVLNYLNLKTGVQYGKIKIEPALKPIKAILKEGYSPFDCKAVIDKKYDEWHGTDFEKFLRPSTLFNSEKFDTYLNQPITNGKRQGHTGSYVEQVVDTVKQAIELNHKIGGDQRSPAGT
jgi:uncharacterized phage protein (TIGR02220 family)